MQIDQDFRLAPTANAALVSIICPSFPEHASAEETQRSLRELRELLRTLGITSTGEYVQNKKSVEAATILGIGKLKEITENAKHSGADILVFDFEINAGQIRNIKEISGLDVMDRNHIILEIFARHAQTKQAKIQIEMARLQYLLPRLTGMWTHFSRQKGGIGLKGEGEQQIELDRRIIRKKIAFYKKQLEEIKKSRGEQKKQRQNQAITAALVGYTNAGKSSLMNRLCQVNILEENKLFATLDSTYRMLNPDTHPPMILIDTVGFISNLPNTLFEGFKTTLESAKQADLLLIVCDVSDPDYKKHLEVTYKVLGELGIEDKEKFIIFNKKDQLQDSFMAKIVKRTHRNSFVISSLDPNDIDDLRSQIIDYFLSKQQSFDLFVPYEAGQTHSVIKSKTNIITTANHEKGIYYKIKIPSCMFNQLNLSSFILGPDDNWENPIPS